MSSGPTKGDGEAPEREPLPVLTEPAEGVPPVITRESELMDCADAIADGVGPVAIDA